MAGGPHVAGRLGIRPGDTVMHTRYRYLADGNPIQLADSYEPIAVTGGIGCSVPSSVPRAAPTRAPALTGTT
ncbi:UTRA domain-containing protein [Micromonospora endophytica]|nr:UTRA domain-containing protein [Micromonospora endophytica]